MFRSFSGDLTVSDATVQIPANSLQQYLPLPVAEFGGSVLANITRLELQNMLLKTTEGQILWRNAAVTGAVRAKLGQVQLDITPETDSLHRAKLTNRDGQIEINGDFQIEKNGDYKADIRIKPLSTTPPELEGMLGNLGRRASDGSYRVRDNGNVSQFM